MGNTPYLMPHMHGNDFKLVASNFKRKVREPKTGPHHDGPHSSDHRIRATRRAAAFLQCLSVLMLMTGAPQARQQRPLALCLQTLSRSCFMQHLLSNVSLLLHAALHRPPPPAIPPLVACRMICNKAVHATDNKIRRICTDQTQSPFSNWQMTTGSDKLPVASCRAKNSA
jgi:hypothetical protein